MMEALAAHTETVMTDTLAWSADQNWKGWNKHDGLNSPILRWLLGWGRWPRMVAIQAVMRAPINLRPILAVPKTLNPKGLALFLQAALLRAQAGDPAADRYVSDLLALLRSQNMGAGYSGACWGYPYPWQDPGFYAPTATPNAVVTAFVCDALMDVYAATGDQDCLDQVRSACDFFLNDLVPLKNDGDQLCLSYMPLPMSMRVMDVSILIASVMARVSAVTNEARLSAAAYRLANYVVQQQTPEGAWYYTDPPEASRIRHDNYHTGFILDALDRYMRATGDHSWQAVHDRGLDFYAEQLFNADGAPRWMSHQDLPHDVHGAAQGILTFSRCRDRHPELADRIVRWSIRNLYLGKGRFAYQKRRFYTKRFTLLRWCNGWMARALANYLSTSASAESAGS